MAQKILYLYNCMFHYRDLDDCSKICEWLSANTLRFVACTEQEDHLNVTDKHLQVGIEIDHEWPKTWSNYWTGGRGKHLLVSKKIPNQGDKNSKRYGYKRWNDSFEELCKYILKEENKASFHMCSDSSLDLGPLKNVWKIEHPESGRIQTILPHKTKSFQQRMLDYWKDNGQPRTERECFSLMCDFISDENWRYIDDRSILRAARWLYSRANRPTWKERLMSSYDDNQITI